MSVMPELEGGDQPWLHSKFKTSLGYTRLCFKVERKRKRTTITKYTQLFPERLL